MNKYICQDVFSEDDKDRCKRNGVKYNQCCQDCFYVKDCDERCPYAFNFNCPAREKC